MNLDFTNRSPIPRIKPAALILVLGIHCASSIFAEDTLVIRPATVQIIDERTIAASDAGLISKLDLTEGQTVAANALVASLDSQEQEILVKAAEVNLQSAKVSFSEQHALKTAENALDEVNAGAEKIQTLLDISRLQANDSSAIEIAQAEMEAASTEYSRAQESRARFRGSVSDSRFLALETAFETSQLRLAKAKFDHSIVEIQPKLNEAELKEQQATISKFTALLNEERANVQLDSLTVNVREQELARATVLLERRKMVSPIDGVVVEVFKKPGEWVEKGTPIMRIISLSELRVEGFVGVSDMSGDLVGRDAEVEFSAVRGKKIFKGVVTHVLPDVDAVNQFAPIWIRFANPQHSIYPGTVGEVRVLKTSSTLAANKAESN